MLGVVAHPIGPSSTDYVMADEFSPAYAIPYGVKNPEEIIPVLKELATPAESAETMSKVTVEQISKQFDEDIAGTYAIISRPEAMSIQLGAKRAREYYGNIFILYCGQYMMGDCSEVKLIKEVTPVAQQALRDTEVKIS